MTLLILLNLVMIQKKYFLLAKMNYLFGILMQNQNKRKIEDFPFEIKIYVFIII